MNEEYDCSSFLILLRVVVVHVVWVLRFARTALHPYRRNHINEIFARFSILELRLQFLFGLLLLINKDYLRSVNEVLVDHLLVNQLLVPFFRVETDSDGRD